MNKVFDGVKFNGVVKPGETYILTEADPYLNSIYELYTIRTDEEFLAAVDMIMVLICNLGIELLEYVGIEKIRKKGHDEETYEIRLQCRDNFDGKLYIERLVLERLHTFPEEAQRLKEYFPLE